MSGSVEQFSREGGGGGRGGWGITFATTSNPLVPLSNLWTIPGRIDAPLMLKFNSLGLLSVLKSSSEISSASERISSFENAANGRLQWWRMPLTSVPEAFPGAGCTT